MSSVEDRLPRSGDEFAGYRIERVLGRGGMGVVYLGRHLMLDRHRALKLLSPELANDDDFRKRFIRESRAAARLEHPHIIPIHEAAEVDGVLFLSMKFVEGSDLKEVLGREGPMDPERALDLLEQVASALDVAHRRDLVHRDIKPQNILVASGDGPDPEGHVYLLDFGLTKDLSSESQYTKTGTVMGTVHYMSPEQVKAEAVDRRTDIYSLGCVLFECLSGSVPYDLDSQWAVMNAHANEPAPRLSSVRDDLPEALSDVLARALEKDRERRFASAGSMLAAARAALTDGLAGSGTVAASPGTEVAPPKGDRTVGATPVGGDSAPGTTPAPGGETVTPPPQPVMAPQGGVPETPTPSPSPAYVASRPGPPQRRRSRWWLVGLLAFLLVGGAAAALLLLRGGDGGASALEVAERASSVPINSQADFPDEIDGQKIDGVVGEAGGQLFAVVYGEVVVGVEVKADATEAEAACDVAIDNRLADDFDQVDTQPVEGQEGRRVGTATLVSNGEVEAVCWTNGAMRTVVSGPAGSAVDVMNELPF